MIRKSELNPLGLNLDLKLQSNFNLHYLVVNEIRAERGEPMFVSDGGGIRSLVLHLEIYRKINLQRAKNDQIKVPMGSCHLQACATDFVDPDGELYYFIISNWELWDDLDLPIYLEDIRYTPGWAHVQTKPPSSGNKIFIPW